MTAQDKADQAKELVERVTARLRKGPFSHLSIRAQDFVLMFLLCIEEMEEMNSKAIRR